MRGYRPDLDGIRAIAILAVFAFHTETLTGGGNLDGGFLGVDMFFVLSGFLITSLLVREREDRGRVGLGDFYKRRALRLLPPLGLALLLAWFVSYRLDEPKEWMEFPRVALAVGLYAGNWFQHRLGTLGHSWSLALEEQYYLLWPPLLLLLLRRTAAARRLAPTLLVAAAGIGLFYVTWRDVLTTQWSRDPANGLQSYGRFAGLALGSAIALGPELFIWARHRLVGWAAGVTVIALLVAAPSAPIYKQLATMGFTVAVAVGIAHLVHGPQRGLFKFLSSRPLVGIGRISYGLYLFHWPLFLLTAHQLTEGVVAVFAGWTAAFMAAVVSYFLVEQHFLRAKLRFGSQGRGREVSRKATVAWTSAKGILEPARTTRERPAPPKRAARPATRSKARAASSRPHTRKSRPVRRSGASPRGQPRARAKRQPAV